MYENESNSDAQPTNKITTGDELAALNEGDVVTYDADEDNLEWVVRHVRVNNPDEHPHHSVTVALYEVEGTRDRHLKWDNEDGAEIVVYGSVPLTTDCGSLDELGVSVHTDWGGSASDGKCDDEQPTMDEIVEALAEGDRDIVDDADEIDSVKQNSIEVRHEGSDGEVVVQHVPDFAWRLGDEEEKMMGDEELQALTVKRVVRR